MPKYVTKKSLYKNINVIRKKLKITDSETPINLINICYNNCIKIGYMAFSSPGLRGMFVKGTNRCDDIIVLDNKQSLIEQNFYCGHELIHLLFHRYDNSNSFNCYETVRPNQDSSLEWQANEGAAELLVPYKKLLPLIRNNYNDMCDGFGTYEFCEKYSEVFGVTISVMQNRLNSLSYEIEQYMRGVEIDNIKILSKSQQQKIGIKSTSLLDLEMDRIIKDFESF